MPVSRSPWHFRTGRVAVNLALLMWLAAEALEGPRWIRRQAAPTPTDAEGAP